MRRSCFAIVVALTLISQAQGGLYYSGESFAPLPSKWSGFLVDHRALRGAGIEKPKGAPQPALREAYLAAAAKLETAAKKSPLSADELADLGALFVRLNKLPQAVDVLRAAARKHADHFRIAANLGTAWQLSGDLDQAAAALEDAVRFAPEKRKACEEYHLKLVRLRQKEGKKPQGVDDLFGVKFTGELGKPPLPANAAAIVQDLALALPADGRLLWQLGEIANALGDVRTAAAILDGCVTELAMSSAELREHRQAYRIRANEFARKPELEVHKGAFVAKSARPLIRKFDASTLPPIKSDGPNPLPWGLIAGTTVDDQAKPSFPAHLEKLDGKTVVFNGFMQPLGDAKEFNGFLLLEYPVGCWFCETPEPTGLVSVELEAGKRISARRGLVKITGTLILNRDNPEDFLFRMKDAKVGEPE
jgi:tetratricopeptide (TPR) repeat protein